MNQVPGPRTGEASPPPPATDADWAVAQAINDSEAMGLSWQLRSAAMQLGALGLLPERTVEAIKRSVSADGNPALKRQLDTISAEAAAAHAQAQPTQEQRTGAPYTPEMTISDEAWDIVANAVVAVTYYSGSKHGRRTFTNRPDATGLPFEGVFGDAVPSIDTKHRPAGAYFAEHLGAPTNLREQLYVDIAKNKRGKPIRYRNDDREKCDLMEVVYVTAGDGTHNQPIEVRMWMSDEFARKLIGEVVSLQGDEGMIPGNPRFLREIAEAAMHERVHNGSVKSWTRDFARGRFIDWDQEDTLLRVYVDWPDRVRYEELVPAKQPDSTTQNT